MAKRRGADLGADEVLAGAVKASAADLVRLIHLENPTGRELGARETAARYARKARLQSLLVRRFASELDVALDSAHPGTVSLRLRSHGRDGCHAVLASLDDDARSWVRRELDLAASAPEPAKSDSVRSRVRGAAPIREQVLDGSTPEALMRRAQVALDAYDYEEARTVLEAALVASRGGAEPAAALLALLVETLGDDGSALAIAEKIDAAVHAETKVRLPLALAAARSGDEARALTWIRGLDDPRSAEIFAALAASALSAGDLDRATAHVERGKRIDPSGAALANVAGEVARARAQARAPAEAAIERLLAEGRDDEAARQANELLSRWPDSATARRAIRDVDERRRHGEAARLASLGDEAAARGELSIAITHLAKALAVAPEAERSAIEARVAKLESALREQRQTERVETVITALDASASREALTSYAELDEELRARVRARSSRQELAWIDRMTNGRGGHRGQVDAALAVAAARELLPRDPEAAIALIEPHDGWLANLSEARRVVREAEMAIHEARVAQARAAIVGAREALAAGAAEVARSRLSAVSARSLPEELRAEADALLAIAMRLEDRKLRGEQVLQLHAAGRLFEARDVADALAADATEAAERARLEAHRDAIRASIQEKFRVEVDDEETSSEELGRFRPSVLLSDAEWLLTSDGRSVVFARSFERWVVVRVLDRQTMRVRPTVLLQTPEPIGDVSARVCGPTLWLTGETGAVVEIDTRGWEVRDFRPRSEFATPDEIVDLAVVVATEDPSGQRYLWVATRDPNTSKPDRLRVTDLRQRRVVRELPDFWRVEPIAGGGEPRVVTTRGETGCAVYTPRGVLAPNGKLALEMEFHEVAMHPSGEGFVALAAGPRRDGGGLSIERDQVLYVATLSQAGDVSAIAEFASVDPERTSSLVSARGSGLIHAIGEDADGAMLIALSTGNDRSLVPLYSTETGGETLLLQDAGARHALAINIHDGGVDLAKLGAAAPELPVRARRPHFKCPGQADALYCDVPVGARNAAVLAQLGFLRGAGASGETLRKLRDLEERESTTVDELVDTVFALRKEPNRQSLNEAERLVARLAARFPKHPEVRLLHANELASEGRWGEIRELLADADAAAFDEGRAMHLHHLRALAAIAEGRFGDAEAELHDGCALGGACELVELAEFVRAVLDDTLAASTLASATGDSGDRTPLRELVAAIRIADARYADGDLPGVVRALDVPVVWWAREVQSLARLVDALLAQPTGSRAERVRVLEALGMFLDRRAGGWRDSRSGLPIPNAWDEARVDEVFARAKSWLDLPPPPRGS